MVINCVRVTYNDSYVTVSMILPAGYSETLRFLSVVFNHREHFNTL